MTLKEIDSRIGNTEKEAISSPSSESNIGRSRGINLPMNTKCSVNWAANRQTVALYDARGTHSNYLIAKFIT